MFRNFTVRTAALACLFATTAPVFGQTHASSKPAQRVLFPTALQLARPKMTRIAPDVWVAPVAPGLWVHTTTHPLTTAKGSVIYPANGMLLETPHGSVLFDTGWNDGQTKALLAWARTVIHHPIRRVIVTHWHADRMGGIRALNQAGIPTYALPLTCTLAAQNGKPRPHALPLMESRVLRDPAGFELLYPGAGHTKDNIVAYFPETHVLFGGCLIKCDVTPSLDAIPAESDVARWPTSINRVRSAFPGTASVVPGHGEIGGDALGHTLALIHDAQSPPAPRR